MVAWTLIGAIAATPLISMPIAWRVLRRRYRLTTPCDERHEAITPDGWSLPLYRYRPTAPIPRREPVLLCHGMLSNRFNVDLDDRTSLARFLCAGGLDAWVMELRGHGESRRLAEGGGGGFDWDFDDYVQRDLVTAIRTVRERTGADRVHWFGHSMGGLILYAACALPEVPGSIRSAAVSDAPASFRPLVRPVGPARLWGRLVPVVPAALLLPYLGAAAWVVPGIMKKAWGIEGRGRSMALLANAIIPWGSSRVLLQFCDMLHTGRFVSGDGAVDYEQGAARADFPLLVFSSARKRMKEEAIRAGLRGAPGSERRYVKFDRASGYGADYTHSSLLLSSSSPAEVFPVIRDWFLERSTA